MSSARPASDPDAEGAFSDDPGTERTLVTMAGALPAPITDEIPARFGRYALSHRLGSGGIGSVYLARATGPAGFEKLVALKVLQPQCARDPTLVQMFLDEAHIASSVNHPNVCTLSISASSRVSTTSPWSTSWANR